jgi:hypothetical protein
MAFDTISLSPSHPSTHVLGVRHRFKVIRIDTADNAAQVIDFKVRRYGTNKPLVHLTMPLHGVIVQPAFRVAIFAKLARPKPATRLAELDIRDESI